METRMQGQQAMVISVADTGGGIPEENLSKLFNPFFTTKPPGKGTGLGLSIVYGIIKMHRGQISVKSELGTGTTFTITLPVMLAKQQAL
jgi:signal transduction histidine kinase